MRSLLLLTLLAPIAIGGEVTTVQAPQLVTSTPSFTIPAQQYAPQTTVETVNVPMQVHTTRQVVMPEIQMNCDTCTPVVAASPPVQPCCTPAATVTQSHSFPRPILRLIQCLRDRRMSRTKSYGIAAY